MTKFLKRFLVDSYGLAISSLKLPTNPFEVQTKKAPINCKMKLIIGFCINSKISVQGYSTKYGLNPLV